jgi:hypothetical protein
MGLRLRLGCEGSGLLGQSTRLCVMGRCTTVFVCLCVGVYMPRCCSLLLLLMKAVWASLHVDCTWAVLQIPTVDVENTNLCAAMGLLCIRRAAASLDKCHLGCSACGVCVGRFGNTKVCAALGLLSILEFAEQSKCDFSFLVRRLVNGQC